MSDIDIIFPWPVTLALVGAAFWPVTACLLIAAIVAVGFTRGWVRVVLAIIAVPLALDCALAVWLAHVGQI